MEINGKIQMSHWNRSDGRSGIQISIVDDVSGLAVAYINIADGKNVSDFFTFQQTSAPVEILEKNTVNFGKKQECKTVKVPCTDIKNFCSCIDIAERDNPGWTALHYERTAFNRHIFYDNTYSVHLIRFV